MSAISTQVNEKIILERIKIMGKNLIAISDFVCAKKAKYVTPSMMVVEGEMELCMLNNSPGGGNTGNDPLPPIPPTNNGVGGNGTDGEEYEGGF